MLIEVMGPSGVGKTTIIEAAASLRDLHPLPWSSRTEADDFFAIIPPAARLGVLDDSEISDVAKRTMRMLGDSSMKPSQSLKALDMLRKAEFQRQCIRGANFAMPVLHDELLLNRALSLFLYSANFTQDARDYLANIPVPDAAVVVTNSADHILGHIEQRGKAVNVYRWLEHKELVEVIERGLELCELAVNVLREREVPVLELNSAEDVTENAKILHTWISNLAADHGLRLSEIHSRLLTHAGSFHAASGRRERHDKSRPFASFITRNVSVLPASAQLDTAERLRRFGVGAKHIREKTILDLGANLGSTLFQLSNFMPTRALGIEFDDAKVALATEVTAESKLDNLEFRVGDLDKLSPAELGEFDVVFCLALEGHLIDREHLFQILGAVTASELYYEGNSGCDVNEVAAALRDVGFVEVNYLGSCSDGTQPANNVRPLISARKAY